MNCESYFMLAISSIVYELLNLVYLSEVVADFNFLLLELEIYVFKFAEVAFDLLKTFDLFPDLGQVFCLLSGSVIFACSFYLLK